jgi:DNA mismatch endonuclease (patch repair protein)
MTDTHTKEQRSRNMARVKNKNTAPELLVRSLLHRMGYRFRLHRRDLPGSPDIVLPRHKKVIFVHGCFWHGHDCPRGRRPSTNREFWDVKLDRNIERDRSAQRELNKIGWKTLVIWQCQTKNEDELRVQLQDFLLN